ncbi:MAG: HAMP domain-containing sensor histidine kinase, partial [Bacteroidota bacterium]
LEKTRIVIEKNYPAKCPHIKANPNQIEQILVNLIINAIDAIEESNSLGGNIANKIIFELKTNTRSLKLIIKDNGIGITQENLRYIFTPFFTTKKVGKGTGVMPKLETDFY